MRKYGWLVWNQNRLWRLFLPKSSGNLSRKHLPFGSNRMDIPVTYHALQAGEFGFPVHLKMSSRGVWQLPPVIGILTSKHPHSHGFRGNKANFRDIIQTGRRMGLLVSVFTPQGMTDGGSHIEAYTCHPAVQQWVRFVLPRPHVVYNRIPDREAEQQAAEQKALHFFQSNPDTHLFNPQFFDKQQLFHWFKHNHSLKDVLPATESWGSRSTLRQFLRHFDTLYVKPVNGKAGKGIMQIKQDATHYRLTFVAGKGEELKQYRTHLSDRLYEKIHTLTKSEPYLIQQGVQLAHYNSRPFDLRSLVQKDGSGRWGVTGLGIRIAGSGGITTHVPRGGSIGKAAHIFPRVFGSRAKHIYVRALKLAVHVADGIERQSGQTLGEISIDSGIDQNDQLWLFEANAKPMKFDEPHIRKRSLERILEYAVYLSEGGGRSDHP